MKGLRLLNNGKWNKPPVLTVARRILIGGLSNCFSKCTLGQAASFLNGTSYDVAQISEVGNSPIIRISNITDPSTDYLRTSESLDRKFWVLPGDLLVSWSASFKSIIWPGPAGYLNQHIFKVSEGNGFDRHFIRHAIEASFYEMQENVVGIGMMHLRRADFLGHSIPAPPIEVQRAVACFLDFVEQELKGTPPELPLVLVEQRRIVAQIGEVAAQINEARALRKQAAREAGALVKTALHRLAKNVRITGKLGDLLSAPPRNGWSAKCDNADDGISVLSLSAVTGFRYRSTEFKRTSLYAAKDGHFWLKSGDILITRSNTPEFVGHVAIYDGNPAPCIYPDLMMRLEIKNAVVDHRFVWYWLQSPSVREFINQNAKGTSPTMKKISQGTVMAIPFPTSLPLLEQCRIVSELDALQAEVDVLKRLQAETAAELDALLPAILDRALKGEL